MSERNSLETNDSGKFQRYGRLLERRTAKKEWMVRPRGRGWWTCQLIPCLHSFMLMDSSCGAAFSSFWTLLSRTGGPLLVWAYGWAFVEGDKKFFYNFVVTFTSLVIALLIGTLELLGIVGSIFDLDSPFWDAVEWINYETVGIFIIILFIIFFILAVISYKIRYGCARTTTEFTHIAPLPSPPGEETSVQ